MQQWWPDSTEPELKPFVVHKDELSIQDGCLLWGKRVVVPPWVREEVMLELHEAHPGISRMKSLARQYVCRHISQLKVKTCKACHSTRKNPAPMGVATATLAWSRVHTDYAGPFMGQNSYYWWTLTQSGWIFTLFLLQPLNRQLRRWKHLPH